jgi:hypothetical protein
MWGSKTKGDAMNKVTIRIAVLATGLMAVLLSGGAMVGRG